MSVQGVTGRKKKSKPLPDNVINLAPNLAIKESPCKMFFILLWISACSDIINYSSFFVTE